MPYALVDLELSQPLGPLQLAADQDGYGLFARWQGRLIGFVMQPAPRGALLSAEALQEVADKRFATRILAAKAEAGLAARWPAALPAAGPSLSIAICTRNRAPRLSRLLASLAAVRTGSPFPFVEILVVDNDSTDSSTREAALGFPGVRYVFEPRTGLDFARNAALGAARGDLLAYLDDDVIVDRHWLDGLFRAWSKCPDAGGYTGLVLPMRLDTEAQIQFEKRGGFGRGFTPIDHRGAKLGNSLYPVGIGVVGAGCNMAFQRSLLLRLGGFDEALDTGAPLPGGGDLDIFYRVLRSGRTMIYEPSYAVYHEHRETLAQLRRQYWSWGLGFMAFLAKAWRNDAALRDRHSAMVRWWFLDQVHAAVRAFLHLNRRQLMFSLAELWGGVVGLCGEYDRSVERSRRIRERCP